MTLTKKVMRTTTNLTYLGIDEVSGAWEKGGHWYWRLVLYNCMDTWTGHGRSLGRGKEASLCEESELAL